jgi:hypothetical protein
MRGENERLLVRQELLEGVLSGMGDPACAPMPGTFLEMLEIAAWERRQGSKHASLLAAADTGPLLTSTGNNSPMIGLWWRPLRAAVDVARRFGAVLGSRQVPI